MNTDTNAETLPFSTVLYFGNAADRKEFVQVIREAKPLVWMTMEEKSPADLKVPVAELRDCFPVVVSFREQRDMEAFVQLVREAKPGMVERKL